MPPRRHHALSIQTAKLFGQSHSNRDYTKEKNWGKNIFNSSFPASLIAYMSSKSINPVYIVVDESNNVYHSEIRPTDLLGIDPLSDNAYYSFETEFLPYKRYYEEPKKKEKIDLVMKDLGTGLFLTGLEIKLTALPDDSTKNYTEDKFSCELVVRRPTICHLACSICDYYENRPNGRAELSRIVGRVRSIEHWSSTREVAPYYQDIENAVLEVAHDVYSGQKPLIIQPVWKSLDFRTFADDCLDVFVWSNLSIIKLISGRADSDPEKINRFQTTFIWLYRMLADYATHGKFNYDAITSLNYGQRNDKAFSTNGKDTLPFLQCAELFHPRIRKNEIKNVILGGGQSLLMPERRFDAFIVTNPEEFK